MVDHDLLHRELAKLPAVDHEGADFYQALHGLMLTTAAALEIDGAGVTVRMPSGATQYITATDPVTMQVERKQDELRQGACVDAIESAEIVAVSDLTTESRWPEYRPFVLEAGFHAIAGVPISYDGERIGAINLYANASRAWTTDEFAAARLLSDLAAGYLINRELLRSSQTLAAQLQHALDSRVVIEQAKGIVAGRHGMDPDAAFEVLRAYARSNRKKLHDVATNVVRGTIDVVGGNAAADGNATSSTS